MAGGVADGGKSHAAGAIVLRVRERSRPFVAVRDGSPGQSGRTRRVAHVENVSGLVGETYFPVGDAGSSAFALSRPSPRRAATLARAVGRGPCRDFLPTPASSRPTCERALRFCVPRPCQPSPDGFPLLSRRGLRSMFRRVRCLRHRRPAGLVRTCSYHAFAHVRPHGRPSTRPVHHRVRETPPLNLRIRFRSCLPVTLTPAQVLRPDSTWPVLSPLPSVFRLPVRSRDLPERLIVISTSTRNTSTIQRRPFVSSS